MVATMSATSSGWRKGMSEPVPSSTREVTAPIAVRVVSAS